MLSLVSQHSIVHGIGILQLVGARHIGCSSEAGLSFWGHRRRSGSRALGVAQV